MSHPPLQSRATLSIVAILCVWFFAAPASAGLAPGHHHSNTTANLVADFAALAQHHPRPCRDDEVPAASPFNWRIERTECAWQDRLRVRRWVATAGMLPGDCLSPQARWWAWARGARPLAWRTGWGGRMLNEDSGPEKRIVLLQRAGGGEWRATEWRWRPSPRAATRRWQEGRWKLLTAMAGNVNDTAAPAPSAAETALLEDVWEENLGARAGEIAGATWRWQADGVCLRSEPVGLGQQQIHLQYSVDDTRLEQRAAMQLQLARRHPKALWLTPFSLVAAPAQPKGGAQFYAVWVDGGELKGQLWMPTRGDGPVVRLRIGASVPGSSPAAVARASQVVGNELATLASRWAGSHE